MFTCSTCSHDQSWHQTLKMQPDGSFTSGCQGCNCLSFVARPISTGAGFCSCSHAITEHSHIVNIPTSPSGLVRRPCTRCGCLQYDDGLMCPFCPHLLALHNPGSIGTSFGACGIQACTCGKSSQQACQVCGHPLSVHKGYGGPCMASGCLCGYPAQPRPSPETLVDPGVEMTETISRNDLCMNCGCAWSYHRWDGQSREWCIQIRKLYIGSNKYLSDGRCGCSEFYGAKTQREYPPLITNVDIVKMRNAELEKETEQLKSAMTNTTKSFLGATVSPDVVANMKKSLSEDAIKHLIDAIGKNAAMDVDRSIGDMNGTKDQA